jgi:transposase
MILIACQRSAARIVAPNMRFRTGFSPKALGMILRWRRSKAKIAVAKKLAVIVHRMWVDGTDFRFGKEAVA